MTLVIMKLSLPLVRENTVDDIRKSLEGMKNNNTSFPEDIYVSTYVYMCLSGIDIL